MKPNIILIGPPCSGKTTVADFLTENYNYKPISLGKVIRTEVFNRSPLGMQLIEYVESGEQTPFNITQTLFNKAIENINPRAPLVFDGCPRSEKEVNWFWDFFETTELPTFSVELNYAEQILKNRAIYNSTRVDRTPAIMEKRINSFKDSRQALLNELAYHTQGHIIFSHLDISGLFENIKMLLID